VGVVTDPEWMDQARNAFICESGGWEGSTQQDGCWSFAVDRQHSCTAEERTRVHLVDPLLSLHSGVRLLGTGTAGWGPPTRQRLLAARAAHRNEAARQWADSLYAVLNGQSYRCPCGGQKNPDRASPGRSNENCRVTQSLFTKSSRTSITASRTACADC
jgi:hypothetical protein